MNLKKGDLIISKDSNIGEIIILDKDYPNHMLQSALYRLPVKEATKYYLLAFIKHRIFREQLDFIVPSGATIRHAKTMFLDCKIPIPNTNKENLAKRIFKVENSEDILKIITNIKDNIEVFVKKIDSSFLIYIPEILNRLIKYLVPNENENVFDVKWSKSFINSFILWNDFRIKIIEYKNYGI